VLEQGAVALPLELCEVARELQADADVVLHAADLAADGDLVLLERRLGGLVLVGVDLHLLAQAQAHSLVVAAYEGLSEVDAALLEHEDHELAHSVLDCVRGEDSHSSMLFVEVEPCIFYGA